MTDFTTQARALVAAIRVPVYDVDYCNSCIGDFDRLDERLHALYPCPTLRALAAIYADRDRFREEWR
jgi:hypothetical protein